MKKKNAKRPCYGRPFLSNLTIFPMCLIWHELIIWVAAQYCRCLKFSNISTKIVLQFRRLKYIFFQQKLLAHNNPKRTSSNFILISFKFRAQNYFLLYYENIFHNSFSYTIKYYLFTKYKFSIYSHFFHTIPN